MTAKEIERLTIVEQQVRDLSEDITELKADVKEIKATLDNLSGGKQALVWFIGIILAIAGIVVGALKIGRH